MVPATKTTTKYLTTMTTVTTCTCN
jgi:hypothetical protein